MFAVDSDSLDSVVIKEIWTDDDARPKSTPTVVFFKHWTLMWIYIVLNWTILFVHVRIYPEMSLITEDGLSMEIRISCQLFQSPFREYTSLSMVVYLQFLGQFHFVQEQAQVSTQNSSRCCLRNAEFL